MNIINFLNKPFPVIDELQKKITAAFAFGAFVFLFMYLFKPFGIGVFTDQQILLYTLGFGGITFLIMLINLLLLDKVFPAFFKDETWTVGKEILITLIHIALIGLVNYFFATWLSITEANINGLLYVEFISLCLAVFPVIVWTLLKENMLLKQSRKEAEKFVPFLQPEKLPVKEEIELNVPEPILPDFNNDQLVTFTSETETTVIKTGPEKIFFISSADNYIKIYMSEGSGIVNKLLRTSLKRTEDDLKHHPQFYRCHRAYIVNLQKVESVSGNARGLKLILKNCQEEVPVSRSLNEEIREMLKKYIPVKL